MLSITGEQEMKITIKTSTSAKVRVAASAWVTPIHLYLRCTIGYVGFGVLSTASEIRFSRPRRYKRNEMK